MRRSYIFAGILALGAFGWMASGQFGERDRHAQADAGPAATSDSAPLAKVRVQQLVAQDRPRTISVTGQTMASRAVNLRAQTAGRIAATGADEGAALTEGQLIARIALDERTAQRKEAEALVTQRQIEYRAAKSLAKKGFRAETQLAGAKAQLDAAQAMLERIRIDIGHTKVTAPFAGILEDRAVEVGDYVKLGDSLATIVDLSPILVVGHVSEREISALQVGMDGTAKLSGRDPLAGKIRYVSSVADSATRTFKVELEIANPGGDLREGLTATLNLPLEPVRAFRISPAVLTLADDGQIGVKIVTDGDIVRFVPIDILADTSKEIWVAGLPAGARLIVVGQEFVRDGQKVEPIAISGGSTS